jgi:hypothetical protein
MALRYRPVRHYAMIYVLTAALGCAAECLTLGIFYPFEIHMFVFRDRYQDFFLTEILVKVLLLPQIGCLNIRYAGRHPIRTAVLGAVLTGLTERVLVATGAMLYFRWHTGITVLLVFGLHVAAMVCEPPAAPVAGHRRSCLRGVEPQCTHAQQRGPAGCWGRPRRPTACRTAAAVSSPSPSRWLRSPGPSLCPCRAPRGRPITCRAAGWCRQTVVSLEWQKGRAAQAECTSLLRQSDRLDVGASGIAHWEETRLSLRY